MALGYGAQHWYTASLGRWMASHQLSPQIWTAGFALFAITMVAVRTLGLMTRFALHPVQQIMPASSHDYPQSHVGTSGQPLAGSDWRR